jgi:hypothetical protein
MRLAAALTIILAAGLVHGSWTNRWRVAPEMAARADRLESIPMVIGEWTATKRALTPRERTIAGAVGYISRNYTSSSRRGSVSVLLLCGLPGAMAAHTPQVCYPDVGYTLGDASDFRHDYGPTPSRAHFRTAVATRSGTNPSVLRIFWSWNDSQGWSAPENARGKFASASALCKLYVVRETSGVIGDPRDDVCTDFLTLFLPEVDRLLFFADGQPGTRKADRARR